MKRWPLLYLGAALLLAACCTPYDPGATILDDGGRRLCAKHRVPLVTVRGYGQRSDIICMLPSEEYFRIAKCNPNVMGIGESLHKTELHTRPIKITYCPRCEAALE